MPKRKKKSHRYLTLRGDRFYYDRLVPDAVAHLDDRAPRIFVSLRTSDLVQAAAERDRRALADDYLWRAIAAGISAVTAREEWEAQVQLQRAMGMTPLRTPDRRLMTQEERLEVIDRMLKVAEIAPHDPNDLLMRLVRTNDRRLKTEEGRAEIRELLKGAADPSPYPQTPAPTLLISAALDTKSRPEDTVKQAFEVYLDEIAVDDQTGKSEAQLKAWKKVKSRAIKNFVTVVGDVPILKITRDDARKFHQFWQGRIRSGEVGYSAGNRDVGNMRLLFGTYAERMAQEITNPFDGLSFKKPRGGVERVPFTVTGLQALIAPGALEDLNEQARRALMVMIETGCRPSEILNLDPSNIRLDGDVPHIRIRHRHGREIKTDTSERDIPLVGIALAAMKAQPLGFPRYLDGENTFSQLVLKYLRRRKLMPNGEVVYSIRHAFEDRMKAAKLDAELRKALFGHKLDRPEYGDGFTLEAKREALAAMALPFDPRVV